MDYVKLGRNIAAARKSKRFTQEQLAEKIDISTVFISQIETAVRKPSLETVCKIAKTLGTTIDALVDDTEPETIENDFAKLLKGKTEEERNRILKIVSDICELIKK